MSVVVPPWAAAIVPVSKSSAEVVPPNGMSRCVWTSTPPGMTSLPEASMIVSAGIVQTAPDERDDALVDVDVGLVFIGGGDDGAVSNESCHLLLLAGPHPRSLSPFDFAQGDPECVEGSRGDFAPRSGRRRRPLGLLFS